MAKKRADVLLVEKGLIDSREKAKRLIMEGKVFIGTERVEKPGMQLKEDVKIYIKGLEDTFVSRGGHKLEKMIDDYDINLLDAVCVDIGASTGGFTHCMLKHGAKKVYAIDVGYNQLDYRLRMDDRVVSLERTNIRYFDRELITEEVDFISIDVSFISLTKILIPARNLLKTGGQIVCLIKPQFEAGRGKVGKNGVVREPQIHEEVIRKIIDYADSIGFEVLHLEYSPIKGPEGNIEYLLHIRKPEEISEEKLALTEHEAESALQTIIEEKTGLSYTPEWDAVIKGIVDNSHTL